MKIRPTIDLLSSARENGLARATSLLLVLFVLAFFLVVAAAQGQAPTSEDGNFAARQDSAEAQAIREYWTPARMAAAQPYPMPTREVGTEKSRGEPEYAGEPTLQGGRPPLAEYLPQLAKQLGETPRGFAGGAAKHTMNPNTDYPPPFIRWTWFGRYLTYPISTIAKMFFDQDHDGDGSTSSFVCSASVVDLGGGTVDRVVTAGHCVNNGLNGAGSDGGWSTNVLICPSYNAGGVNPATGCWAEVSLATFTSWITSSNADGDLGCIHTATTGTVVADEIGNVTGTLGRAANYNDEPVIAFGYPAGAPFLGVHIIASASADWYNVDWGSGADSKYIGSDQTGGASGGPWILGLEHRVAGYADTDGDDSTDPPTGGPFAAAGFLDGVNSHQKVCGPGGCICGGALALCSQEIGGPAFTDQAGGTEDFFAFCTGI